MTQPVHRWFEANSPIGPVYVAHHNGKVTGLLIRRDKDMGDMEAYMRNEVGVEVEPDLNPPAGLVAEVENALAEGRTDINVDLSCRSDFQRKILAATAAIPKGQVRTYGELAEDVGSPGAARAVGTAMARNPVPLLIPCHRVVPASGGVGHYGGGSNIKRTLLTREGAKI